GVGSRVEAEGRMARSEGGASPKRAVTTERRGLLPFCLAPTPVALILALAGVARWAEVRAGRALAADIGAALRALANAKIHSNATHSSISIVSLNAFEFESFVQAPTARTAGEQGIGAVFELEAANDTPQPVAKSFAFA